MKRAVTMDAEEIGETEVGEIKMTTENRMANDKEETTGANIKARRNLGPSGHRLGLSGHVGFDSLPDQLVRKCVHKGFVFNMLCVGETGIGKSTLVDSMFKRTLDVQMHDHDSPAVKVQDVTYDLKESNVALKLTVVETVGYGDQINKEDSCSAILEYIDKNYEAYLQEEMKINRSQRTYRDTRVHVCLYVIAPTGHSLKSLDLVCMKKLDKKVNIIPVIAKSDTISKNDLQAFKDQIMAEIYDNGIEIYKFPVDDETVSQVNFKMNNEVPFAVIGSRDKIMMDGESVRARQYPWGTVLVEDENHCDFVKLREMLLQTNMQDLIEKTHEIHYELYRREHMEQKGFKDGEDSIQEAYQNKRGEYMAKIQKKDEMIRQVFVQKVKEQENEFKKSEQELNAQFEEMKKRQAEEKKAVDLLRKELEEEQIAFDKQKQRYAMQQAENATKSPKNSFHMFWT